MKVAILAGGRGSRLAEETEVKPKPMVEIGGHPILWHIMKIYDHFDYTDFIIALGYKGEVIKKYMVDYCSISDNLTVDIGEGNVHHHDGHRPDWTVDLIDTGIPTKTGGRIKRLEPYVENDPFMLTWGDGVADIDIDQLVEFHNEHDKLATMTVVRPPARYGHIEMSGNGTGEVLNFSEKPQLGEGWINGAFFVLEPGVFDYIDGDDTVWEHEPLENLARDGELMAYRHDSFWQCMDTLREKRILENYWESGDPPWRLWDDGDPIVSTGLLDFGEPVNGNGDLVSNGSQ